MVTDSDNRIRLAPVSEGVHRPLWSVMIPTFHCARFLHKTLESVLSQATPPPAYNSTGDLPAVNGAAHGLTLRTSQA